MTTKRYTVFCGSSAGTEKIYAEQAYTLGKELAERGIGLVFGGGKIGMMGAVADGVMAHQGEAIGVIPKFLCTKEIAHGGLTKLHIVETMHERKMMMNELCTGMNFAQVSSLCRVASVLWKNFLKCLPGNNLGCIKSPSAFSTSMAFMMTFLPLCKRWSPKATLRSNIKTYC